MTRRHANSTGVCHTIGGHDMLAQDVEPGHAAAAISVQLERSAIPLTTSLTHSVHLSLGACYVYVQPPDPEEAK